MEGVNTSTYIQQNATHHVLSKSVQGHKDMGKI